MCFPPTVRTLVSCFHATHESVRHLRLSCRSHCIANEGSTVSICCQDNGSNSWHDPVVDTGSPERGPPDLQEELSQHLLPAGSQAQQSNRKRWVGRAGEKLLARALPCAPRAAGVCATAQRSSASSPGCGFPYITSSDVQHLFVPAVKPLLALHQLFSHLSASAGAELAAGLVQLPHPGPHGSIIFAPGVLHNRRLGKLCHLLLLLRLQEPTQGSREEHRTTTARSPQGCGHCRVVGRDWFILGLSLTKPPGVRALEPTPTVSSGCTRGGLGWT